MFPPDTDTPGFENENKTKVRFMYNGCLVSFEASCQSVVSNDVDCSYYTC